MQKKMDAIRQKLFLDNHHKMERFCLLFVIFVLVLGLLFGICFKTHQDNQKLNLSTTALYTKTAQFSLTKETLSFIDLYRNNDFTKAFVLLKVNGDMSNLSIKPNDYQILVTGQESKLTCNIRGGVYVFGTTGYIGLYFTDASGFDSALYNMVLRSYNIIGEHSNPNAAQQFGDASYSKFNQANFFVNLRGEDGVVADFLSADQPVVEDIYKEIIAIEDFNSIIEDADKTLSDMNTSMSLLNEYMIRLQKYNISVPELPIYLSGDQIVTDGTLTATNPLEFDVNTMSSSGIVSGDASYSNTDMMFGTVASVGETDKLYFVTNYVYPGGVQFNYQDAKVTDPFLTTLYPDGRTYKDFMTSKSLESQTNYAKFEPVEKWYYSDGREFIYDEAYAGIDEKAINDIITSYNNELYNLCYLKRQYQCEHMIDILKNEADANSIVSLVEFYSSENSVLMY